MNLKVAEHGANGLFTDVARVCSTGVVQRGEPRRCNRVDSYHGALAMQAESNLYQVKRSMSRVWNLGNHSPRPDVSSDTCNYPHS